MANNDDLVFVALSAAKHAADGVPDAVADWLSEHVDPETGYVVDDTLTIEGAAADAKAVGDRIESAGLTDAVKQALLQLASKVAYIDDDGQDYYDDLYAALYNGEYWAVTNTLTGCTTSNAAASITKNAAYSATITASSGYTLTGATVSITMGGTDITSTAYSNGTISIASVTGALAISITAAATGPTLSSISAVYTQSGTVYDTDSLDSLKSDLVVTATYSDASTETVPSADYTLSGTLTAGTSTITVSYSGKTTTFSATVTWGYKLRSTFDSSRSASVYTGKQFTAGETYTIACEYSITSYDANTNSFVGFIFGNKGDASSNEYVGLQENESLSGGNKGEYNWGVGISWSSGKNITPVGHTIRYVSVFTVQASENTTFNTFIRDVTSSGTTQTFSGGYAPTSVLNGYTLRLGSQNSTQQNGFTGTVTNFVLENREWSSSDIAAYLEATA